MKNTIALIFDFDDTLAPDSTSHFLQSMGVDVPHFWRESVDPLIRTGWDPVPAMMYCMTEYSNSTSDNTVFTKKAFEETGKKLKFFPGVTQFFPSFLELAAEVTGQMDIEINLEYYIVSSGIYPIIKSTRIAKHFTEIWASDFHYEEDTDRIVCPKNIISFTDKTRYLFQIKKNLIGPKYRGKPFEVNTKVLPENIRVPFENMIFIGDGYTDVPCFALLQQCGGTAIAVYDRNRREKWGRAWGFTQTGRATNIAASDYRKETALHDSMIMAVERICHNIALDSRTYRA